MRLLTLERDARDIGRYDMYQCHNCDAIFHETDQTECQRKHGQCPYCHSDDVTEVGTYDKEVVPCQEES